MSLSREDVLRELELLPVWRLRAPKIENLHAAPAAKLVETQIEPEVALLTLSLINVPEIVEASDQAFLAAPLEFLAILSDDHHYLFIIERDLSADAETLLQNMLRAIDVKPKSRVVCGLSQIFSEYTPKLVIAMGEYAAQSLLADPAPLASLRGKVHQVEHLPVNELSMIVTYSPTHLLAHLADKAKAWQDLCLAVATLKALTS